MTKIQVVELILTGRRVAARLGKEFVVDPEKLGRNCGFSSSEIADINEAVADIEAVYATVIRRLS